MHYIQSAGQREIPFFGLIKPFQMQSQFSKDMQ